MSLVTSPVVINVPTRGLLAVETMHAIVQWLANLNIKRNAVADLGEGRGGGGGLFWVKKEEMPEGKKARRASTSPPPPPPRLSSRSVSTTEVRRQCL